MIQNKYPGKCTSCNKKLLAGEGFAYKNGNVWLKCCNSTACMNRLGQTPPGQQPRVASSLSEDGVITMSYDRDAVVLIKSLPGARWKPENKTWTVSVADRDLPRLIEVANTIGMSVPDSLKARLDVGTPETREAARRAERTRTDGKGLYPFQKEGVKFLALHNQALLADDMGLGKSVQSLLALPDGAPAIIVCPVSVKYNWRDEILMWRPEYKVTICSGNGSFKIPDTQEELRAETLSEFGDCCECLGSFDDKVGGDNSEKFQNFNLGIDDPSVLNLHLSDSLVGLDVSDKAQAPNTAQPVHKIGISVPNLNNPPKSGAATFRNESSDRPLTVNNSSNISNGKIVRGKGNRISTPIDSRNVVTPSYKHVSEKVTPGPEGFCDNGKLLSSGKALVSSGKLGVSNICPRCSKHIAPKAEIVITTYNILPDWLVTKDKDSPVIIPDEIRQALSKVTLIADEFHKAKNFRAQRSQKIKHLSKLCKRTWGLTGTPLMNRPTDLYGILEAGNMHPLGGWPKFVELFNGYKNQWGGYEFGDPKPEVPEKLKRVMLRRLKSEVLKDLPPKTYQRMVINGLDPELVKEMDSFLDSMRGDGDNRSEVDDLDLPPFEEFSKIRAKLAKARIPEMLDLVENYEESETPLLVFSAHRAPIDELAKREGWKVITGDVKSEDRRAIVQEFQGGKLKGVGLTIAAGGEGLTLTRASNVLFVDLDWTPALNIQAEDRVCRIGQTSNSILIMRMVSSHPLEMHVHRLLEYKIKLAYEALEKSIQFKPLKQYPTQGLVHETEDELRKRIDEAQSTMDRNYALGRIASIAGREIANTNEPEPALTPKRKEMLREALSYMLARCDGAHEKDGVGFNKPHAAIAHWMGAAGMREEDDLAFRVLERILCRYRRQLKGKFESIWKPDL